MRTKVLILFLVLFSLSCFGAGSAIAFIWEGTMINNIAPVYSSSGSTWVPSGTASTGVTFKLDGNTLCFPSSSGTCDSNIEWNGTHLIINQEA